MTSGDSAKNVTKQIDRHTYWHYDYHGPPGSGRKNTPVKNHPWQKRVESCPLDNWLPGLRSAHHALVFDVFGKVGSVWELFLLRKLETFFGKVLKTSRMGVRKIFGSSWQLTNSEAFPPRSWWGLLHQVQVLLHALQINLTSLSYYTTGVWEVQTRLGQLTWEHSCADLIIRGC